MKLYTTLCCLYFVTLNRTIRSMLMILTNSRLVRRRLQVISVFQKKSDDEIVSDAKNIGDQYGGHEETHKTSSLKFSLSTNTSLRCR